jgi:hypothetical protein
MKGRTPVPTNSPEILDFLSRAADRFNAEIRDPFGSADELLAAVDPILEVAERLLRYEQRLDGLERQKAIDGGLPPEEEQFVLDSIEQNATDAADFVRLSIGLFNRYEEAGTLGPRVRIIAESLGGLEVPAPELFDDEYVDANLQLWSDRGRDRTVLEWARQYFPPDGLAFFGMGEDRVVLSGMGRRAALAEFNPSPLPIQDPDAFVNGGYLFVGPSPDAVIDGVSTKSMYGGVLAMGREVVGRFRQRADATRENGGVVIYRTRVIPAILIVIGLILLLLSLVIMILCAVGLIGSDWVCNGAKVLFVVLILAGCLAGVGICSLVIAGAEIPIPPLVAAGASTVEYSYYE